jgi:hypothetical protein
LVALPIDLEIGARASKKSAISRWSRGFNRHEFIDSLYLFAIGGGAVLKFALLSILLSP